MRAARPVGHVRRERPEGRGQDPVLVVHVDGSCRGQILAGGKLPHLDRLDGRVAVVPGQDLDDLHDVERLRFLGIGERGGGSKE